MAMASDDKQRCAQCTFVVLSIFPKIMQDLLADTNISPAVIYRMIMNNDKLRLRLDSTEKKTLKTLVTDGFKKLDVSLMYKIIKFFNLITPPTRNWGSNPLVNEIELGDDIERIRRARNDLVHRFDANVSEQAYTEFFEDMTIAFRRLDKYLKKSEDDNYENLIKEYKSTILDEIVKEKLLADREKEEGLKQICTCPLESHMKEIHVLAGKDMDEVLERVKCIKGENVTPIKIIIYGVEDSEDKIKMINSFKNELSSDNITFKGAEKNCIILFVDANNNALQNHEVFFTEVRYLLQKVFLYCKLSCKVDEITYAVVTYAEEEIDQDDLVECEEEGLSMFGKDDSIVLHVDMKNKTFESNERVGQVLKDFFDNVARTGNGQQFFGKQTTHALLLPEDDDAYKVLNHNAELGDVDEGFRNRQSDLSNVEPTSEHHFSNQNQELSSYRQAQIPVETHLQLDVHLRHKFKIKRLGGTSYGCTIINDQLLFTDHLNQILLIYDKDGVNDRQIILSDKPWMVSVINQNDVAVTYDRSYLEIIDTHTGEVKSIIETTGRCIGISYQNGLLYVVVERRKIDVINLTGELIRSFPCPSSPIWYIATGKDRLYLTDHSHDTLFCCDLMGSVIWEFTDDKMKWPYGVTLDRSGNIYVSCLNSNNVKVVSPDGHNNKELLTVKDGLQLPTGIYYDQSKQYLFLCSERNRYSFLYDVKNKHNK